MSWCKIMLGRAQWTWKSIGHEWVPWCNSQEVSWELVISSSTKKLDEPSALCNGKFKLSCNACYWLLNLYDYLHLSLIVSIIVVAGKNTACSVDTQRPCYAHTCRNKAWAMAEELDKPLLHPDNFNRDNIDLVSSRTLLYHWTPCNANVMVKTNLLIMHRWNRSTYP